MIDFLVVVFLSFLAIVVTIALVAAGMALFWLLSAGLCALISVCKSIL